MAELRQIKNLGELPFADAFAGEHWLIDPGSTALVPAEAVDLWFGDNNQRNDIHRRYRDEELDRLHVRYGAYHDPELWEAASPKFEVSMVDGTVMETVLSDPKGDKVTVASTTVSEQSELVGMIQQQQADLEQLRREYREMARKNEALTAGSTMEDKPVSPASRASRSKVPAGSSVPVGSSVPGVEEDSPS